MGTPAGVTRGAPAKKRIRGPPQTFGFCSKRGSSGASGTMSSFGSAGLGPGGGDGRGGSFSLSRAASEEAAGQRAGQPRPGTLVGLVNADAAEDPLLRRVSEEKLRGPFLDISACGHRDCRLLPGASQTPRRGVDFPCFAPIHNLKPGESWLRAAHQRRCCSESTSDIPPKGASKHSAHRSTMS